MGGLGVGYVGCGAAGMLITPGCGAGVVGKGAGRNVGACEVGGTEGMFTTPGVGCGCE